MADNITQITDVIENLNFSMSEINSSDIINSAISSANADTGGWLGLFVLGVLAFAVLLFVIKNQRGFNIVERSSLILVVMSIVIDIMFFLFKLNILDNLQIVIFIYTSFVVVGIFAFLKKEIQAPEG